MILNLLRTATERSFVIGWLFPKLTTAYAARPARLSKDADESARVAYWRRQLAGDLPVLQLLTDFDRPAVQRVSVASEPVSLPPALVRALKHLGGRQEIPPFVTLLTAFGVLLYRYSGQDDILVGAPIGGDPLPMRIDLSGDPTFQALLGRVYKVTLDAYDNRDAPIRQLMEQLQARRGASRTPLFQALFAFHDARTTSVDRRGPAMTPVEETAQEAVQPNLTLSLNVTDEGDGLSGVLSYNAELFEAATVARMVTHFQVLLESAIANPTCAVSQLPLLTDAECRQVFAWSRNTAVDYPRDQCVHQLFEAQAARTPDATALTHADQVLSYAELNERANQLARYIHSRGVGPDQLVGVCLERSVEMVTSLLAVLKAGGAYVWLDPMERPEHLAHMVRDAGILLLIGRREQLRTFAGDDQTICVDPYSSELARQSTENLECDTTPDNLAYAIYTSGTTGTPKGVEVVHRGIVRLIWGLDFLQLQPTDAFLLLSSMSFDLSTLELWHPLLQGARLAIFPGRFESFQDLRRVLDRERVTSLWLTASLFNSVIDEYPQALSGVRDLLIGGEALSVPHVKRGLQLLPSTQIINGYGPTEATTFTHCYSIPRSIESTLRSIPIGRPIGATEGWILDPRLNPVPIGVPGDLYVGGDGLARGYRNQPVLTAEKFIPHPFDATPGARLYATGDRARYLPDGLVEFLGRSDHQVKVRGFRVELEGIEATLTREPAVRQAVVTCEQEGSETRLVAYVVMEPAAACSVSELRAFLESKLPDYMVPSQFIVLEELPLKASGKVDRRALPKSGRSIAGAARTDAAPRTPTEQSLAGMWTNLLQVDRVSIADNFFELGGHSLLAARLFVRIEQAFGKSLPVSALLGAPTLAQLATVVEEAPGHTSSALEPIQPHGAKPPVFIVPGVGGGVLGLAALGRSLGDDQPVFGLCLKASESREYSTVEARAARYLDEVFAVAPQGPYCLAGYSSGGIFAFEMARQLYARGHTVALLAIFDQGPLEPEPTIPFGPLWISVFLRNLPYRLQDLLRSDPAEVLGQVRSKGRLLGGKVRRMFARSGHKPADVDIRDVLGVWKFPKESRWRLESEYLTLTTYVPKTYPGRITLFRARAGRLFTLTLPDMGWGDLSTGGVDVRVVPGSHFTMLDHPHVQEIADELRARLNQTRA